MRAGEPVRHLEIDRLHRMGEEGILVGPCAIAPHLHDAQLALLDYPKGEACRRRGRLAGHRQRLARSFAAEPDIRQPRLPVDLHSDHHVSAREHRGSAGANTRLDRARSEADLPEDLDEQRVLLVRERGYVRSFIKKHALAIMLAAGLSQAVALSQSPLPQTESSPSRNPALVSDWADRLVASDPTIRAAAEAELVQGAQRSLPVLRRLLAPDHEDLHAVTFEIIQRIGPPAIPLLVDLLRDKSDSIRRAAVSELVDLAPHTEKIQPALRRTLQDEDAMVAGDAARALGALGPRASPSVDALVTTLAHPDPYVRVYAAEALASIGPNAAKATNALAGALRDPEPGVRWAACEALASIGPAAQSAVPGRIEALEDEYLYVRIFAAGALGSIGLKARPAEAALKVAANDPALRSEAEWALSRISGRRIDDANERQRPPLRQGRYGEVSPEPSAKAEVSLGANPPIHWDPTSGRNIVWRVELGNGTVRLSRGCWRCGLCRHR